MAIIHFLKVSKMYNAQTLYFPLEIRFITFSSGFRLIRDHCLDVVHASLGQRAAVLSQRHVSKLGIYAPSRGLNLRRITDSKKTRKNTNCRAHHPQEWKIKCSPPGQEDITGSPNGREMVAFTLKLNFTDSKGHSLPGAFLAERRKFVNYYICGREIRATTFS